MIEFGRVSIAQYDKDVIRLEFPDQLGMWDSIKLPQRATAGSAGYDFFAPFSFEIPAGKSITVPTGINVSLKASQTALKRHLRRFNAGLVLEVVPRSGLGFKHSLRLNNTIGVIDEDYINSDNEGHIILRMTNGSDADLRIAKGSAFAQGIVTMYFKTDSDNVTEKRNGGFGSTTKHA